MTLTLIPTIHVIFAVGALLGVPPAVAAPSDDEHRPEIFVEVRYVQVDTTKLKVIMGGYEPSNQRDGLQVLGTNEIQMQPLNAMRDVSADDTAFVEFGKPGAAKEGGAFEGVVMPGQIEFKMGGQAFSPARIPSDATKREDVGAPEGLEFLKAIASPRLLLYSGQRASFASGTERAYLEKESGDCLRLKWTCGEGDDQLSMAEGSAFEVFVTLQDDGAIRFDPMTIQYRYMIGREPIEGVPLDVGKPIIKTMKMSISLVMKQDATAVFAFPRDSENEPLILALVRAFEKPAGDSKRESPDTPAAPAPRP